MEIVYELPDTSEEEKEKRRKPGRSKKRGKRKTRKEHIIVILIIIGAAYVLAQIYGVRCEIRNIVPMPTRVWYAVINAPVESTEIVKINSELVLQTGRSSGEINFINSVKNKKRQQLIIKSNEDGTIVYISDMIEPANRLQTIHLTVNMSAGTHYCTAYIYSLSDNGTVVRIEEIPLTITIKETVN